MHFNDRILVVDDNRDILQILRQLLKGTYNVMCATGGEEALRLAAEFQPNLVLLDIMMPGMDGNGTCRCLHQNPALRDTKIIMLSAKSAVQDRLTGYAEGAVDYITKPFNGEEVIAKVRAWMQMSYRQQVESMWQEAEQAQEVVGLALASLAGFRDTETGEHLFRMRWYSHALAEQLAVVGPYSELIDETFLQCMYRASPLHDIGKVAISDSILHKPGRLTPDEFEQIKQHTVVGSELLTAAAARLPSSEYMAMAAVIARSHHERFDGAGYPDGLTGQNIPLPARIVAVADVFDALTSPRVYKPAISVPDAAEIIERDAGRHFDPVVVDAFTARLEDFDQACHRFADGGLVFNVSEMISQFANDERANLLDHAESCF